MRQEIRLHGHHHVHTRPEWVIMGVAKDDGTVMLVASDQLSYAELEAVIDEEDLVSLYDRRVRILPQTRYEMRGELRSIIYTVGATWMEAFTRLFGLWEPEVPRRPQLPAQTDQVL
jgi:hypothetical protein